MVAAVAAVEAAVVAVEAAECELLNAIRKESLDAAVSQVQSRVNAMHVKKNGLDLNATIVMTASTAPAEKTSLACVTQNNPFGFQSDFSSAVQNHESTNNNMLRDSCTRVSAKTQKLHGVSGDTLLDGGATHSAVMPSTKASEQETFKSLTVMETAIRLHVKVAYEMLAR